MNRRTFLRFIKSASIVIPGLLAEGLKSNGESLDGTKFHLLQLPSANYTKAISTPPTITKFVDFAYSDIANYKFISIADLSHVWLNNSQTLFLDHTAATNDGITRNYYATPPNAWSGTAQLIASFTTNAQVLEILTSRFGCRRMLVDGRDVGPIGHSGARYISKFDFGSSETRQVICYLDDHSAGFFIGPNATFAPFDLSSSFSIGFAGDSIFSATGTYGTIPQTVALELGIPTLIIDLYGGTGYVWGRPNNFLQRLKGTSFAGFQPKMFVVACGINDRESIKRKDIVDYYSALRAALPKTVIVAVGPWCPYETTGKDPKLKMIMIRNMLYSVMPTISPPWIIIDNLTNSWKNSAGRVSMSQFPWQTGTGNVGAPKRDGNGDIYVSADGTHPTAAGVDYLASRLVTAIWAAS